MRRRRAPVLLLVVAALVGGGLVLFGLTRAGDRPHPPATSGPAPTAAASTALSAGSASVGLARLVAACRASAALPYSGEQRVRIGTGTGTRTSVVAVAHVPGSGVRLTLRSGADAGATFVGQLGGPSLLPVVDPAALTRIASRYSVTGPTPGPRVAGRPTDVVELRRTAGARTGSVAARFWLDRDTALPLQREVVDGAGRVQQASTWTSISYRRPASFPRVTAVVGTAADLGQGMTPAQLDGLRSQGWLAPAGLPDGFDLVDARMHGAASTSAAGVLQLAYTDGISVVSVFEQRGRLDPRAVPSWTEQRRGDGDVYLDDGTPRRVVWSARGHVYTVVSDDPAAVDAVMTALPGPTGHPGTLNRLHHGVGRLVSWVNPFG